MYLLVVLLVYCLFAKMFIDWKRWREFYPTIQFYIICNLLYNLIFYQHTLWAYKAVTVRWLNHTLIDIAFSFFIVPVVLMIYLQYYPKGSKQFFYVSMWVAYFTFIEYLFYLKGLFIFANGWNIGWSTVFNIITFSIIRIHHRNTLRGLIISVPIVVILLFLFHPTIHELK
ncbi:CBO0543 family protein [Paenibacillus silviterrae]|uniref:CBO0543 family protein n=1 Tax=Paenibacillus silviterrae TaxID=3242194 RepID=UPI00254356DD|nr:CBO0543 family protein [Paenibacillus chinjuensis]